ncbi:galactosyltransferase-like protein [Salegentibacter sp. 24]|uniref:glycosyltransferase family 2 protein n=1 Tax=Salegentibacter sp. 24 TaxID=2183986 RepID=UPI00105CE916|nr:glycosyltransferase [Salegentibacter sp. 24]TDN89162.1 galactosyltransferase-like protein [Salegentibacter sp. 24]
MISIIYANRNRDIKRIKDSLDSLASQNSKNFKVIFVDYGSRKDLVNDLKMIVQKYEFTIFFNLEVSQLLWNKSKALNYGINHVDTPFTFIADTDLIFHPNTISYLQSLEVGEKFFLFRLGYLSQAQSKNVGIKDFEELEPSRFGKVNGMVLASTKSLRKVNGLDEFFHFYGAEDEDLFARLENAGYKREMNKAKIFYHNWHRTFSSSKDKLLTGNPRVENIMRVNQRHYQRNRERGILQPIGQDGMGQVLDPALVKALSNPGKTFKIFNILAHVEHFLREELPSHSAGEIVKVEFVEDSYYSSLKYKLKKILGKQTQPYCSMKEVNDLVLKEILYNYRNHNYSFEIKTNLKSIVFCIQLLGKNSG